MTLSITTADPAEPEIVALLEVHLALMRATSPPDSVHALEVEALRGPDVTFWTVCDADALIGCGALKDLGGGHGEIKSMHVREARRGRGIAGALVEHVIRHSRATGFDRLSLETGSTDHFAPARALYARHGFAECGPFGDYVEDWHSTFMTKTLAS